MNKISVAISGILLSVLTANAQAEDYLSEYDLNGDGQVSREEIIEVRQAEFDSADLDGNTFLSLEKYTALKEAKRLSEIEKLFNKMDENADGSVTATEFRKVFPAPYFVADFVFNQYNGDDNLMTLDEFTDMRLSQEKIETGYTWAFNALDKDGDNQLSAEEYVTPLENSWDNGDSVEQPADPEEEIRQRIADLESKIDTLNAEKDQLESRLATASRWSRRFLERRLDWVEGRIADLEAEKAQEEAKLQ